MDECEAAFRAASSTPAVSVLDPTDTVDSCDAADGWWVGGSLSNLAGWDDSWTMCQADGQYVVQVDGVNYPTCVAYGAPNEACTDSNLICPEHPNNPGVFGYAGNQRNALAPAVSRADFGHPMCPTASCKTLDTVANSGTYWSNLLLNNPYDGWSVTQAQADSVCVEDNAVMVVTREGKRSTCVGWSMLAADVCNSQKYLCAGHSGEGEFTFGWPGQIMRTLAVAVNSDNGMHPQCPLMICSAE